MLLLRLVCSQSGSSWDPVLCKHCSLVIRVIWRIMLWGLACAETCARSCPGASRYSGNSERTVADKVLAAE